MLISIFTNILLVHCSLLVSLTLGGSVNASTTPSTPDYSVNTSTISLTPDPISPLPVVNETMGRTTTLPTTTTTDLPQMFENALKKSFKTGIRMILPRLMTFGDGSSLSPKCSRAFLKYIGGLTNTKVWAVQMLDATGKIPIGVTEGTFTEYGAFDLCLDIVLPLKNGSEDFRGKYCVVEVAPTLPPIPKNFSISTQKRAKPLDTMGTEYRLIKSSFYHLKFHIGICIPSSCSVDDMRNVVSKVSLVNQNLVDIKIPKCYTKEEVKFQTIHIVVICILLFLVILAVAGTVIENLYSNSSSLQNKSGITNCLEAFSIPNNYRKLVCTSTSTGELKALHGIRSLSMAWVMLSHTYGWTSYKHSRRPENLHRWFSMIDSSAILNGWLSVESFFFLSGLLVTYTVLQVMQKTGGKMNIPIFIIRRYLRMTPPLLLTMGLVFFLPIISSGPFWHDRVSVELESCRKSWWMNLLYISNWFSINEICVHHTWYLSADFQLHILSLLVLYPLHRSSLLGMSVLATAVVACTCLIGTLTYIWDLPPAILISSGNNQMIDDEINFIYIRTFTHVGPYCVGMATGYLLLQMREKGIHLSKRTIWLGWCASITLSLSSVYGIHSWNTGLFHGPLLTSLYAALHRTTFIMGVAWVTVVCIRGKAGPVNWILSSKALMPLSRLTFMIYLLHGLVMWTRVSSRRTAMHTSHYNLLYEYVGHVVTTLLLAVPCYLLVEAPMSNLERLMFSRGRTPDHSKEKEEVSDMANRAYSNGDLRTTRSVQLTSVKAVATEAHISRPNGQNHES